MPTGYTVLVGEGKVTEFRQFAMDCARAFGANIMLRDEGGGGEMIRDYEPAPFYANRAKDAKKAIDLLSALSDEECERRANAAYHEAEQHRYQTLAEYAATRERYEAMLAKVKAWTPPTPEHVGLRDFMVDQLERSIRFDCSTEFHQRPTERMTGKQWRDSNLARAKQDLEYYEREYAKECERVAGANAWNKALRESLK